MLILGRDQLKDPSLGYARTFVRQVEDCLGLALERGVQDRQQRRRPQPRRPRRAAPRGRARARASTRASRTSRATTSARRSGSARAPLTANAYLGGFGIAAALAARRRRRGHRPGHRRLARGRAGHRALRLDADVVRRAGRRRRRRARARVRRAGHRRQLLRLRVDPDPREPLGFPLAEIAADGSCVITKHDGTGGAGHRRHGDRAAGLRDPGAPQLPRPRRHHPPRHRSRSPHDGPDRVRISGVRGLAAAGPAEGRASTSSAASATPVELVLAGLDIEEKAAWVRAQLHRRADATAVGRRGRWPAARPDADTEEAASLPAAVHGAATLDPTRSARRSPRRWSSSRWRRTPGSR